ncbi:hypothetical protein [Clavibacter zhangzhiyongii]|uniref:hypothetical protein n=1 Tax=Clavibacter zhangzhiyongii TaxID=2768071 RepID=UPI0039E1C4F2
MSTPATPFHKRPLWIAVAALLALILVVGGIAAASGAFSGGGTPAAAPTGDAAVAEPATSASPSASALPDGAASVCGLPGYEETSSLTQAPQVTWKLIGTMAVPDDPEGAGPGTTDADGLRTCFAHTARGALYAVASYFGSGTDGRLAAHLPELAAPGSGRDAAAKRASGKAADARSQIAGFKVLSYSASETTIDLALDYASPRPGLASLPIVMRWVDGDWKIVVTDDGQLPLQASRLQSLGGYIPWSGA